MKTVILCALSISLLYSCGSNDDTSSSKSNSESSTLSSEKECPHCNGAGKRTNNITGEYKDCSSCGGDGKVTSEQYKRLAK